MAYSRRRLKLFFISLLGIGSVAFALQQDDSTTTLLKVADEMVQRVAQLRGLEPKAAISKGVKTREEIAQFLNEHVRSNYDENELKREGRMLQKLGLIPADIDYQDFVLKMLTEQVGGYYDPEKKTLFVAGWLPVDQQKPVMVHELTHALQDQYFDINRFLKEDRKLQNDDRALAHQAIFEGDAMAVMLDSLLQPAGRNFAQLPDLVFIMRAQFSTMESQFAVFKSAPMYLKESLLFPYGYGASFLQRVRAQQPWSAVDEIYSDLPASSEQIIHPEKYLTTRDEPKPVPAENPSDRLGKNWRATFKNVLGEFTLYLLLKTQIPEEQAKRAAAGWGGDQVYLLEDESRSLEVVYLSTLWDSAEDAQEFFQAARDWLLKRFPNGRRQKELLNEFAITADGEQCAIRYEGSSVRMILGLSEAEALKLKTW